MRFPDDTPIIAVSFLLFGGIRRRDSPSRTNFVCYGNEMLVRGLFGEVTCHTASVDQDRPDKIRLDVTHPTALRVAVTDRDQVNHLDEEWAEAGVYLLLDRPASDGSWYGYLGKSAAAGGVKLRLRQHARDYDKRIWYRAILMCPSGDGWDEAEVAWLEDNLHRALSSKPSVTLSNTQAPDEWRLSIGRQMRLQGVAPTLMNVLELIGHPTTMVIIPDELLPDDNQMTPAMPMVDDTPLGDLTDFIRFGMLKPDDLLLPTNPRYKARALVTGSGHIEHAGTAYISPSDAAETITGKPDPEWTFWAVPSSDGTTVSLGELRQAHR